MPEDLKRKNPRKMVASVLELLTGWTKDTFLVDLPIEIFEKISRQQFDHKMEFVVEFIGTEQKITSIKCPISLRTSPDSRKKTSRRLRIRNRRYFNKLMGAHEEAVVTKFGINVAGDHRRKLTFLAATEPKT